MKNLKEITITESNNLEVDKIREIIDLLKKHEVECDANNRYVEAELCKKKIKELELLEEDKLYSNLIQHHQNEKHLLIQEQNEELAKHNIEFDKQLIEMNAQFEMANVKLSQKHEKEFKEEIEKFQSLLPTKIKPSTELIKLTKTMEELGKQRDYVQAHLTQVKIAQLSEKEKAIFEKSKEKKLEAEIAKIKARHENETKAIHQKMTSMFDEFKKRRALEFDLLVRKYKNRHKELEQNQTNELTKFSLSQAKNMMKKSNSMKNATVENCFKLKNAKGTA